MRNKRKRKKQEKKPKSDVNPLNKIKQLIGIKNSVNCNTITKTYNLQCKTAIQLLRLTIYSVNCNTITKTYNLQCKLQYNY